MTIAPGIMEYGTPSHGGIHVSATRLAQMPESWRESFAGDGWYEEDCDWALVALAFPECFDKRALEHALGTAERWHADKLADFTPEMRARYTLCLVSESLKIDDPELELQLTSWGADGGS